MKDTNFWLSLHEIIKYLTHVNVFTLSIRAQCSSTGAPTIIISLAAGGRTERFHHFISTALSSDPSRAIINQVLRVATELAAEFAILEGIVQHVFLVAVSIRRHTRTILGV